MALPRTRSEMATIPKEKLLGWLTTQDGVGPISKRLAIHELERRAIQQTLVSLSTSYLKTSVEAQNDLVRRCRELNLEDVPPEESDI